MAATPPLPPNPGNFSKEELAKISEMLKKQATIQQEINSGLKGYMDALEKVKSLTETINYNKKVMLELEEDIKTLQGDELDLAQAKLDILKKEQKYLEEENEILKKNVKEADKFKIISAATLAGMVKGIAALPNALKGMRGSLQSWGLFELDKAIRMSVLDMGLLDTNASEYRTTIEKTAMSTLDIGVGIEELTRLQSDYSQELGRTVMLGQQGLEAMANMSKATGLGAEGAAQMAAEMENQGVSAERTADFLEDSMNTSSKLGLNASKVIKNIAKGVGLLNKYNFKEGYKGLEKMAKTVTKLGVEMDFATGMADKMFDIEGAVDMAAQLQVLGGAWANLADPFRLAYLARNDVAQLTEEIGKAAGASAVWDEKMQDFKIGAMEMDKMRIIAQQTGVSLESLVTAAKNFKKFEKVGGQIKLDVNKDTKEFIQNTAKLNEKGEATILIKGEPKLVSALTDADKKYLETKQAESKSLKQRAEASQTFDEEITNLINMFKTAMLPALEGLGDILQPLLKEFKSADFKKEIVQLGHDIKDFILGLKGIVETITKVVSFLGPQGIIAIMLVPSIVSLTTALIANSAKLVTAIPQLGGAVSVLGKATGIMAAGFAGMETGKWLGGKASKAMGNEDTEKGDDWGYYAGLTAAVVAGGLATFFTGGLAAPLAAAAIAGVAGGAGGKIIGDSMNQPVRDGILPGEDRGLIQNGQVTPIDNKDDVIAYKPNGPVDKFNKGGGTQNMKISFDEIQITGEIKLSLPGNQTTTVNLANDPSFISAITTKINGELERRIKGMNMG